MIAIEFHKTSLDRITPEQVEFFGSKIRESLITADNPYEVSEVILADSRRDESGKIVRREEDLSNTANTRWARFSTCKKGKGMWGRLVFAPKERGFNTTYVYFSFKF